MFRISYRKCRKNGEFALKNDGFVLKIAVYCFAIRGIADFILSAGDPFEVDDLMVVVRNMSGRHAVPCCNAVPPTHRHYNVITRSSTPLTLDCLDGWCITSSMTACTVCHPGAFFVYKGAVNHQFVNDSFVLQGRSLRRSVLSTQVGLYWPDVLD